MLPGRRARLDAPVDLRLVNRARRPPATHRQPPVSWRAATNVTDADELVAGATATRSTTARRLQRVPAELAQRRHRPLEPRRLHQRPKPGPPAPGQQPPETRPVPQRLAVQHDQI